MCIFFKLLGPFVIADSSSNECSETSSKVSLDELCPLSRHHVTQSKIAELRHQGANINIIQNFVDSAAILEIEEIN